MRLSKTEIEYLTKDIQRKAEKKEAQNRKKFKYSPPVIRAARKLWDTIKPVVKVRGAEVYYKNTYIKSYDDCINFYAKQLYKGRCVKSKSEIMVDVGVAAIQANTIEDIVKEINPFI